VNRYGNIERSSSIDFESGEQVFSYSIEGENLPVEYISDPLAVKYIGYDLIRSDLTSALKWITLGYEIIEQYAAKRSQKSSSDNRYLECLNDNEGEILQSLFISSVT
jgi:hypothetical protein